MAPEVAAGGDGSPASDVYGVGALLHHLIMGEAPPGPLEAPKAVASVVSRAMQVDPVRRHRNAEQLRRDLTQAAEQDELELPPDQEIAAAMSKRTRRSTTELNAETEGLVAGLLADSDDSDDKAAAPATGPAANAVDAILDDLAGEVSTSTVDSDPQLDQADAVAEVGKSETVDDFTGEFTSPDDSAVPVADPISQMIRLESGPVSTEEAEAELAASSSKKGEGRSSRRRHADRRTPSPQPAAVATPADYDLGNDFDDATDLGRRRRSPMLWLTIIIFCGAGMAAVIYTQSSGSGVSSEDLDEMANERKRQATMAAYDRAQAKAGELVVRSSVPEAAVWMLVGRTPAESFPLPSSAVHEVRLEHEGYVPLDMRVTATHWSGDEHSRVAYLSASLVAGELKEPLPAYPPEPESPPTPGGPGRGKVVVDSTPQGAEVWLLVGFTPEARLAGVEAGRDYQFKLQKDGHNPAYVVFKAADWYLAGPDSPVKPLLEGAADPSPLPPAPKPAKRTRKTGKRR